MRSTLVGYANTHHADVDLFYRGCEPNWRLDLYSRSQFVNHWIKTVCYDRHGDREPATIVMFNAPFDLSRLADHAGLARGRFAGGFSLALWTDGNGNPADWRPLVDIKSIDSKRALKAFTTVEKGKRFRGHFLDLRTLVFALTGKSHSLASACEAFRVENGKVTAEEHGHITPTYIDYCRRDVQATTELYDRAVNDYARHPIELQATKAYSPASVAKSYLRGMGITPILDRLPNFSPDVLGYCMSAFYGGRAEAHIRHTPMPVTVCDFTSMYPTVDALMGLWDFLTHESVDVTDATDEIRRLLDTITLDDCFRPDIWPEFVGIAQIAPDADILPVRANYGPTPGWNIGINPLFSAQLFWYTIPDLVAATLLTGKPPRILRALRFTPAGPLVDTLTPIRLRGEIPVDPRTQDFFRSVVEQRQHVKDANPALAGFLKVLANAGSYGIFAEMNRQELSGGQREHVIVHGADPQPWTTPVAAPEQPGAYCFPPIAACITGAARLMLTLLERLVTDAGGTWVFCDTDSMAIVADETGTLLACPGGPHTMPDGGPAVRALSHQQVTGIRARFADLNPYQPGAVADILKAEFTGWCYAISAKRYALYDIGPDGTPILDTITVADGDDTDEASDTNAQVSIRKNSEHGLGHLLNPTDPDSPDRNWIRQIWHHIITTAYGRPTAEPDWLDRPALGRVSISSPAMLRPVRDSNTGKSYPRQVKPFNFLLCATVASFGGPPDSDPERFRLIAPYESDPTRWDTLGWRNLYDPHGPTYRITTTRWDFDPNDPVIGCDDQPHDLVHVKTYRHVMREYRHHAEYKASGPDGRPCRPETVRLTAGLLGRRPVHVAVRHHIGKETNRLDDVTAGIVGTMGEVFTDYTSPRQILADLVLPVLDRYTTREIARKTHVDHTTISDIRTGKTTPRPELQTALIRLAVDTAITDLDAHGTGHPWSTLMTTAPHREWESVLSYWANTAIGQQQQLCPCGCGTPLTRRQTYATNACRMRHNRRNRQ